VGIDVEAGTHTGGWDDEPNTEVMALPKVLDGDWKRPE